MRGESVMSSRYSSSVNRSRTTRTVSSGSSYRTAGAFALFERFSISAHSSEQTRAGPGERLLGGALRGGAHDQPVLLGLQLLDERLQPPALGVGEPAADAGHVGVRSQDEEAARQRDLRGQPGALAADRVLRHLDEDRLPVLQHVLDPGRRALEVLGRPVHLAGVQDGVASASDVDERRLHPRQDVLDAAEVDVADHRLGARTGHVVLHELALLEHGDLVALPVLR